MRYALAFHPEQIKDLPNGWKCLVVPPSEIEEPRLAAAIEQGWIVIGSIESDILDEPIPARNDEAPVTPRRVVDVDYWREDGA